MRHPLPAGTRVHHRACLWNEYFNEGERQRKPSWGWATVIDVQRRASGEPREYPDGSYEYNVRYDAPMFEDGNTESWWASYHIDQAEAPSQPYTADELSEEGSVPGSRRVSIAEQREGFGGIQ